MLCGRYGPHLGNLREGQETYRHALLAATPMVLRMHGQRPASAGAGSWTTSVSLMRLAGMMCVPLRLTCSTGQLSQQHRSSRRGRDSAAPEKAAMTSLTGPDLFVEIYICASRIISTARPLAVGAEMTPISTKFSKRLLSGWHRTHRPVWLDSELFVEQLHHRPDDLRCVRDRRRRCADGAHMCS
jgi:hypothetical protein